MKKIYNLTLVIFIFSFINSCSGYKPIFTSKNTQFQIENYSVEGDKFLSNKIYSKLYSISKSNKDNQNLKKINIIINTSKIKKPTIKSTTGKILEYKITLDTKVLVKDFVNNTKIFDYNFIFSINYKTQAQYYDTINLENKTIESLVDKTYQELLLKLSEYIKST